ncbi:MAG: hypothetical protein ABSD96_10180 [Candidatus Korobacteraceae bacterium]
MYKVFGLLLLVCLLNIASAGGVNIVPTTTLAAETANNTSASDQFPGSSNGNAAPGPVSKLPLQNLLYSGATTRIYVHVQPWWGDPAHINIGYDSADPVEVHQQIVDMISRGINGIIVDWYGIICTNMTQCNHENAAMIALLNEAELHPGFEVAVGQDWGDLDKERKSKRMEDLISDLNYVHDNFEPSPSYMRRNGRPVITFFGTGLSGADWSKIRKEVQGSPLFIFLNSVGFTDPASNGAFAWNQPTHSGTDMGLSYLDRFYKVALSKSSEFAIGSAYKGFNDSLASWGQNLNINQQCGQTWLASFAEAGNYYSADNQLENLQIVTWNDYEEGSEIETGIDNCITVVPSLNGQVLTWTVTGGSENTLDHYVVFISSDGQNLMPLAEITPGNDVLDLSTYGFAPGQYTVFVEAIGQPSILNHISPPLQVTFSNAVPE